MCKFCEPEDIGEALEPLILSDVLAKEHFSQEDYSIVSVNTSITAKNGKPYLTSMVLMGGEAVSVGSISIIFCPRCGRILR